MLQTLHPASCTRTPPHDVGRFLRNVKSALHYGRRYASFPMTPSSRHFLRNNGLSITVTALFVVFLLGQIATGLLQYNEQQIAHGRHPVELLAYLGTGHFLEVTAENWESEFLQMGFYVWLTSFLFQKGSSESRKIDEAMPVDRDPRQAKLKPDTPWPVRRGGWVLKLYEYSLSIAFFLMFLGCFWLHAEGGARLYSEEQVAHGGRAVGTLAFIGTSQFWFESFQNWQSEFLSLAAMVVLSIFLRHRGSPESKPVDAPHGETGE
jgi:hypothetical protein